MTACLLRYSLPFIGLLLVPAVAAAQTGEIVGRVADVETLAPLGGVWVEAVGQAGDVAATASTDAAGRFRLMNLPPGTYTVATRMIGYEVRRVPDVRVSAGAVTELELELTSLALRLNPVIVTASRRQEKALDAPASVAVVPAEDIIERPVMTPVDHLRSAPGVDVITYGLQGSNVVVRGFNNIFSGALHTLTDNRIAAVPSLRVNLMQLVPAVDDDVERMEVVLGPGAALYGPGTANGILHILTRSPLDEQGTVVSIGGGEQDVVMGQFRTAHRLADNFGVKLSGQFVQGKEWFYEDPIELQERQRADADPAGWIGRRMLEGLSEDEAQRRFERIARRDFDIERYAFEARADWQLTRGVTTVFSAGQTVMGNSIELTGIGAAQASDWKYSYYQARATAGRFFAQAYLNTSDAGETFLLRDGATIIDRSKLFVGQLQHGFSLGDRQHFTYGADYLRTMPETAGTINNPDADLEEVGGYLQSESHVRPWLDLVLAARLDTHNRLDRTVFSPRAALVFKPAQDHNFRVTYNSAFETPTSLNLFLNIHGGPAPDALGALGFGIRAQGPGPDNSGFRFRMADGSLSGMRSPFWPAQFGGPGFLLPANSATLVQFWAAAVQVLAQMAAAQGQPMDPAFVQYLSNLNPQGSDIGMALLDPNTQTVARAEDAIVPEVTPLRESRNTTFEVGYKGLLGGRILLAADAWYEERSDFVSPLVPQTPLVLMAGADVHTFLHPRVVPVLMAQGMSQEQAEATVAMLAAGLGQIPLAVISSEDVDATGADLLVTYRNMGNISLYGFDLAATMLLTDSWSLRLAGSLASKDHFRLQIPQAGPYMLARNAPKSRASAALHYRNAVAGFNGEFRVRYSGRFTANSAGHQGILCRLGPDEPIPAFAEDCVDSYTLADLTLGYRLPGARGATIQLAVQNLFDTTYQSFARVPEIGRLALVRLRYEF